MAISSGDDEQANPSPKEIATAINKALRMKDKLFDRTCILLRLNGSLCGINIFLTKILFSFKEVKMEKVDLSLIDFLNQFSFFH